MRFFYLIGIVFFVTGCCVTHIHSNKNNPSFKDVLIGKWQWTNNKDTFTIQLFSIDTVWKSYVNDDKFGPQIYGWHRYVENGVVIESSFPDSLPHRPFSKGISGMIMNKDSAQLWFYDITRDRYFRIKSEILDSEGTTMLWITHRPQEKWFFANEKKPKILEGQTIPSPITLHKIFD